MGRTDKWSCSLDKLLQISMELSSTEPLSVCKTQIDIQTNKQIKNICTFTYTDWQVSTGSYTDDLAAEKSLGHQIDADLRSFPKYTINFISVILSLGASMLSVTTTRGVPLTLR